MQKIALELFYGLKSDGLCALKMVSVPVVHEGKKLNTSPCKYLFFPTLAAVLHGMKPAEDFFDTTVAFLDKPTLSGKKWMIILIVSSCTKLIRLKH